VACLYDCPLCSVDALWSVVDGHSSELTFSVCLFIAGRLELKAESPELEAPASDTAKQ